LLGNNQNYVIYLIKLVRSKIFIEKYSKLQGKIKSIKINLKDFLDEDLNLSESLKHRIINELYLFNDTGTKYLCIELGRNPIRTQSFLFDIMDKCTDYMKEYEIKGHERLKYSYIIRDSPLFKYYTYGKIFKLNRYHFDKGTFSLCISGDKNMKHIFNFNIRSINYDDCLKEYYNQTKVLKYNDAAYLIKFQRKNNIRYYGIDTDTLFIRNSTSRFIAYKDGRKYKESLFTRKLDLKLSGNQFIWNKACYYHDKIDQRVNYLKYIEISSTDFAQVEQFFSQCQGIKFYELEKRIKLMVILKDRKVYRDILKTILYQRKSMKKLILINIAYNLSMINQIQFDDLFKDTDIEISKTEANIFDEKFNVFDEAFKIENLINKISAEIDSYNDHPLYSIYIMILYDELRIISSSFYNNVELFSDFICLISISSIRQFVGISINNDMSLIDKLHLFIENIHYNTKNIFPFDDMIRILEEKILIDDLFNILDCL
jgi:hypothetical protein